MGRRESTGLNSYQYQVDLRYPIPKSYKECRNMPLGVIQAPTLRNPDRRLSNPASISLPLWFPVDLELPPASNTPTTYIMRYISIYLLYNHRYATVHKKLSHMIPKSSGFSLAVKECQRDPLQGPCPLRRSRG